jgi:hypothetical protein
VNRRLMAPTEGKADETLMIRGLRSKYEFLPWVLSTLHSYQF